MSDLFLGLIALAVLVMAALQVAAVVVAARAARRLDSLVERFEREVHPVVTNLHALTADAARATALAAAQAERVDRLFGDLSARLDQTRATLQAALAARAREGLSVLVGIKAALAAFRDLRDGPPRRAATPGEEEDPLFIG